MARKSGTTQTKKAKINKYTQNQFFTYTTYTTSYNYSELKKGYSLCTAYCCYNNMSSAENKQPLVGLDALSTALTASRREPGEVNTIPATTLSVPRSYRRQEGGDSRKQEGGRKREHIARDDDYLVHRNQNQHNKKARRRGGNERKSDATERHRQILIEQQNFHDCEIKFLPLIRRWENAIRNKNSNQLLRIYKELIGKMWNFTAPFFEEYDVKTLISESKHLVFDRDVIKQMLNTFSGSYGSKIRHLPEGFKARKDRNEDFNKRTAGNEYLDTKKRHVPEDFKARNEDFNNKRTTGKKYVDIFAANGEVLKSCEKKLRIILLRAIKLGRDTPYREQFLNAKTNTQQLHIASSVWGAIRNTEYPPVRFLHNKNTDEWVEVDRNKINQLIAVALSGVVHIIQPTDNDIMLGPAYIPNLKREREKMRRALDRVINLGKPTNRERFQKEIERGDIKQQRGIAIRILEDIQKISDPPVRFMRQIPNTYNWEEVTKKKVTHVLCNEIKMKLMETQPSGNDVLQFGLYGEGDASFDESEGNRKIRRLLHTEGFLERYRIACLEDNGNRVEHIIEVQKLVLEHVQQLTPPMRFLFQISQTGTWMKLAGYNRLLSINNILWDGNNSRTNEEDLLIFGHNTQEFSFEDTEKLRHIITQTGQFDYSLRKFRQADSKNKKHEVAEELLFFIRTLNPCLKFLHNKGAARWRVRDKTLVTQLLSILQNTKANDSQIDDTTSQSARVASVVRDLPSQPRNIASLSECNDNQDDLLSNTETYFMVDDTIYIDIEPEAEAGSEIPREQISYERLPLANEQMKIKEEPEEEHTAPIDDQSSNFPADEDSNAIKREPEQKPKQEIKCENENENEETDNDTHIEIIEIDATDGESTTRSATQKVKEEQQTGDDNPPGIKTIDVSMSDVSIGGDVESTSLSKTRKATAVRIVRGRSLEVTLPLSIIRQCMNGRDVLRSAATQCVLDKSHVFIFSDNIKKAIYDEKKVVRYEFRGQNPTSAQFKSLPIDDILHGDEDTVLIKMSVNDVEGEGGVTLEDSLF